MASRDDTVASSVAAVRRVVEAASVNARAERSPQEPAYGESVGRRIGDLDIRPDGQVWFEQRVDPDWIAAYRLVPQDGQPIVAEIRLYPYSPKRGLPLGEWTGDAPSGGIPAEVLRKVRVRTPLQGLSRSERRALTELWGNAAERVGFTEPVDRPDVAKTRASFAAAYAVATQRSSRPVQDVANALGHSATYVRDVLHDARQTGYLSSTGRRGQAGGALTARGLAALSQRERRDVERNVEKYLDSIHRRRR